MFIGHFALGLAAKRIDKRPSLAILFVAAQFLDLLWPVLVLLGIESLEIDPDNTLLTPLHFTHYPYSHSLFMAVLWGILFGLLYYAFTRNRKGSLLLGSLVLSHWVLDFITHAPDLPLSPFTDTKVGLGLWNHPMVECILEIGFFTLAAWWYYRVQHPKRKIAYGLLIGFLLVVHILNLLGPPPPSTSMVAWSANLMWLIVLWAWWVEKE